MSAAITAAAVGVGASIYSGAQAGKAADAASAQALQMYQANQAVAKELKERQLRLVDKPLEAKIAELQGKKITASGQQALDRFNFEMASADRAIQEQAQMAGEGATGGRQLTQQFRRAQGIAGINLQDAATKSAQLGEYLQMAQQTPGWASVATGANTQMGNYQAGLAENALAQESSAYGAAAKGLGNLASMYATYRAGQKQPAPAPKVGVITQEQAQAAWDQGTNYGE